MPLIDVPTVHAVTDADRLLDPGFPASATAVLEALGPRGAVHLRGHPVPGGRLLATARQLAPVAAASGAWLVVNDRLDVALTAGIPALQLGRHSLPLADARRLAPGRRIGVSVHDPASADAAQGADWLLVGHVFATASHPGEPGRGLDWLRALCAVGPPVVAIGGITPANAAAVRAAGAHGVAALRGIWDATEPARAATEYL
jgi:thiazole tautomerase (transcriptional regulator TenI)